MRAAALFCSLALVACVEDQVEPEGEGTKDASDNGGGSDGAVGGDDAGGDDAQPPDLGELPPPPDIDADVPPPPPPPEGQGCPAYCQRLDECLAPACPALGDTGQLCNGACRNLRDEQLRDLAQADCETFNQRIFDSIPQLARFCDDAAPPPEGCERVCDLAEECGAPGGRDQCLATCRAVDDRTRQCLFQAQDCASLGRCFNQPMPPDDRQRCQGYCERQSQCVFMECAAGTLPDGWTRACIEACNQDPPPPEEMGWVFQQLCPEVVAGVRERDDGIDARCDNDEEDVCALLCDETVHPCSDEFDQADCEARCEGWGEANLRCLQLARDCREVNGCFGDPEGQARCEHWCERLQTCLHEACPPRILPPELDVGCTAGCLQNPPTEEQIAMVDEATCREVREIVYRNNQQLRPICEGGRDFRPSPDECAAFCDNGLQDCIGLGGRNFCLAACASLDRDQYGCALEARGDCVDIAACLEDAP